MSADWSTLRGGSKCPPSPHVHGGSVDDDNAPGRSLPSTPTDADPADRHGRAPERRNAKNDASPRPPVPGDLASFQLPFMVQSLAADHRPFTPDSSDIGDSLLVETGSGSFPVCWGAASRALGAKSDWQEEHADPSSSTSSSSSLGRARRK